MKLDLILTLAALPTALASAFEKRQYTALPEQKWSEIEPSTVHEELNWIPCYRTEDQQYGNLECARLKVPMDYDAKNSSCSGSDSVILALFRAPALKPTQKKPRSLLVNTGGPGASGLELFHWNWWLHAEVAPEFDLITWDTRGMFRSVPRQECWATEQRRSLYATRHPGAAIVYDDPAFLNTLRKHWSTESAACESFMSAHAGNIHRHVSGYHNAHDMLSVMKALGETEVNYWGISWGTVLGQYFATLFPDKVGRMVLESNVDIRQWRSRHRTLNFADTETITQMFFEECAKTPLCHIHEPTAEAVEKRFDAIMNASRLNLTRDMDLAFDWVLPYAGSTFNMLSQGVVNFGYLGRSFASSLSWGLSWVEEAAKAPPSDIPEAEAGSGGLEESDWGNILNNRTRDPFDPDTWRPQALGEEYTRCNDFGEVPNDIDSLIADYEDIRSRNRFPGLELRWAWECVGKKATAHYNGTFGAQTKNPILFSNNELDIVTPLASAERNAEIFPGSQVLVLEGIRHWGSLESQCALVYYRKYFEDGTMPPTDTLCPQNPGQWFSEAMPFEKRTRQKLPWELGPKERDSLRRIQSGIML